jgi:hypothetical protein
MKHMAVLMVSTCCDLALPENWVTPMAVKSGCGAIGFPEPTTPSSRNRLIAVVEISVDLVLDALPDLLGAHVRIFH